LAASFFGAAVFAAAGLAAGSVAFAAPKQNAAPINDRATVNTVIRIFIMRAIPAELPLGINTNHLNRERPVLARDGLRRGERGLIG
jgi:hypothetical protein